LRVTGISQQPINANELYTKALPGSCWFQIIYCIWGRP